jgi:uncharacterized protein
MPTRQPHASPDSTPKRKKPSKFTLMMMAALVLLFILVSLTPKLSSNTNDDLSIKHQPQATTGLVEANKLMQPQPNNSVVEQVTPEMQFRWGLQYAQGNGTPKDDRSAAIWWFKAAEQGHLKAQVNLAWAYENGAGVNKDYASAAYWYTKASQQDDAIAQFKLGTLYEEGMGVDKNVLLAFDWYRKSAGQGYAEAQNSLGTLYAKGSDDILNEITASGSSAPYANKKPGPVKDEVEALLLFQKAAAQDNANAQYNLGGMYANGIATAKDEGKAYYWLLLSAEKGNKEAQAMLEKMASRLTPEQKKQAELDAKAWKNKPAQP